MGSVQGGVSPFNPRRNAQAKTEAVGGWQEGDHRRHEEALGTEEGRGCEDSTGSTEEDRRQEGCRVGRNQPSHGRSGEAVGLLTGLEQAGSANKLRRKDKASLIYRPDLGLLAGFPIEGLA
jgi:hypothetical protein